MAGATIQWLRDEMKFINSAAESEALAKQANPESQAIVGPSLHRAWCALLGPNARGAVLGMTRDTGAAEIVRAALESVSYQTRDLMDAMGADMEGAGLSAPNELRVDGGMVANDWFAQNLSDLLGRPVSGRLCRKPPRWGQPILPVCRLGFSAVRRAFLRNGSRKRGLMRRWMMHRATADMAVGRMQWDVF